MIVYLLWGKFPMEPSTLYHIYGSKAKAMKRMEELKADPENQDYQFYVAERKLDK